MALWMIPRRRPLWPSTLVLATLFGCLLASVEIHDRPAFDRVDRNDNGTVDAREARRAGVPRSEVRREDGASGSGLSPGEWDAVDLYTSAGVSLT